MTRVVTFILLLQLTTGTPNGDSATQAGAQIQIRELESQFERAVVKGDIAFFERVLADDFTHTTHSGVFRNRKEWLANHKAGQSNYDALNPSQMEIRVFGDVSVVTGRISPQGRNSEGQPIAGQYRFIRVWVKRDGAWKAIAFQSTREDKPAPEKKP